LAKGDAVKTVVFHRYVFLAGKSELPFFCLGLRTRGNRTPCPREMVNEGLLCAERIVYLGFCSLDLQIFRKKFEKAKFREKWPFFMEKKHTKNVSF